MQFSLDCYPCSVRHALLSIRRAGIEDEDMQMQIMRSVLQGLLDVRPGAKSPEISIRTHEIIRGITGVEDPYQEEKLAGTREALALAPELKERIHRSADPFETAVRLSIAGNIIDYGPTFQGYDLEETIARVLREPLAVNHLEALRAAVADANEILYLGDNAGETVFDRLLIETIAKPVVFVVRDAPILNDATLEDAQMAGLDEVAEIISCGARAPGTILELCSAEFLERFRSAELIISKGMGNFEALSEVDVPVFFLLQVKCDLVARDKGVPLYSLVVKSARQ